MSLAGFDAKAVQAVRDALRADGGGLCAQHVADSLDRALAPGSAPAPDTHELREAASNRNDTAGWETPYSRFCEWLLAAGLGYYATDPNYPYGIHRLTPSKADQIAQKAHILFGAAQPPCPDHGALVCEQDAGIREMRAREHALIEAEAMLRYLPDLGQYCNVAAEAVRDMHGVSPCMMVPESEAKRLVGDVADLTQRLNRVISERDALKEREATLLKRAQTAERDCFLALEEREAICKDYLAACADAKGWKADYNTAHETAARLERERDEASTATLDRLERELRTLVIPVSSDGHATANRVLVAYCEAIDRLRSTLSTGEAQT